MQIVALSPVPSGVAFRPDGAWHRFTVIASVPVKLIANPTGAAQRVEIATSQTTSNCPSGQNNSYTRSDGQYIYLAGCVAGTGKVELRRASDNRLLRTYTFTIVNEPPTRMPPSTPSLSPDPSTVAFRADGRWHRFTVNSSQTVKVIANPADTALRVETTIYPTHNYCPPEQNDIQSRWSGQYVYLAGCFTGTGTVELRSWLDNRLLRTYTFTIASGTPDPTATPTRAPTMPKLTPTPAATLP